MSSTAKSSHRIADAIGAGGGRLLRSRRLMRAPICVYRPRLGFLFGSRMLMLEHIGRISGARRYVVLEVFGHPVPNTYIVVSGFGHWAQWYRNVRANPHVRVVVGSRAPTPAVARELTAVEADMALRTYVARHPRAWETFKPVLESTLGVRIGTTATNVPMVRLDLTV